MKKDIVDRILEAEFRSCLKELRERLGDDDGMIVVCWRAEAPRLGDGSRIVRVSSSGGRLDANDEPVEKTLTGSSLIC